MSLTQSVRACGWWSLMLKHSTSSQLGVSHHLEAEQPRRSQVGCSSLRPPVRRSSHHLETQMAGDAREGSDTPGRREPKECERGRVEVLETFSARARREDEKQYGACGCGGHALRAGRRLLSASVTERRPHTQKGHDMRLLLYTALAPYPVQCTHVPLRNRTLGYIHT